MHNMKIIIPGRDNKCKMGIKIETTTKGKGASVHALKKVKSIETFCCRFSN